MDGPAAVAVRQRAQERREDELHQRPRWWRTSRRLGGARGVATHEAEHDVGRTGSMIPSARQSSVTVQKMKASARRVFMATSSMGGEEIGRGDRI